MVLTQEEQETIRKAIERENAGRFWDTWQTVDVRADETVHPEAAGQSHKRENAVGIYEALGNELPASGEVCAETESYGHLKVEK